jgi:hypothetical protein
MPRRDSVTRRHIEKRQEFGFGPRAAPERDATSPRDNNQATSRHYIFDEALEILGLADAPAARKLECERQLSVIILGHWLALRAEDEETPARKAEAFHGAIGLYTVLERILQRIADTSLSEKAIVQAVKQYYRKELQDERRLPQALEHELMKLQLATDHSVVDCCRVLKDHYRDKSKLGRNKTYALRNTIHSLQAFASENNKELTWMDRREARSPKRQRRARATATGRNIPVDLIRFLTAILNAAGIEHPSYGDSPSKFRRLMVGPRIRPPQ